MNDISYFYDGYTRDGFVQAAPLVHGELRFRYRPALVEERSQLVDSAAIAKSDAYDRQAAAFMAQKIVAWSLVEQHGREVHVSAAALLRLQPELFVKVYRVIMGWAASDIDPRWPLEAVSEVAAEELAAAVQGRSVGEIAEEHDEKN